MPLSPGGVRCGQMTNRSVEVWISAPNVSQSFTIDHYEVTYTSVTAGFPLTDSRDVVNTNDKDNIDDVLIGATAGVSYEVTVISKSGHLTSPPVMTKCTAGQFSFILTYFQVLFIHPGDWWQLRSVVTH